MSSNLTDKYLSEDKSIYALLALTIGICAMMGLIRYFTPYLTDDQLWSIRWLNSSEYASDKPYIIRGLEWMYNWYIGGFHVGSARLGDLSTPFTVALMPNWMISSISAICVGIMILFSAKIADIGKNNMWIYTLLLFLLLELLPWHNGLAFRMYSINYVWSSALILIVTRYFLNPQNIENRWLISAIVVLSFITSLMHEALSVIVMCGFVGYLGFYIIYRSRVPKLTSSQGFIILSIFIGCIIMVLCPSMQRRFGVSIGQNYWKTQQIFWWVYQIPSVIYVIIGLFIITRKNGITLLLKQQQIFFISATLAGIYVYYAVYSAYRVCWFGLLFCIVGSCQLVAYRFRNINLQKAKLFNSIGIIVSLLIFLQLADTARWQYKLNEMHQQVLSKYKQSADGNVYIENFVWHSDIPWWANLHIGYNNPFENSYYDAVTLEVPNRPRLGIIPMEVFNRKYTPENFKQATPYPVEGGYVFPIRGDSIDDTWVTVIQKYNDWHDENCQSRYFKFTNRYGQKLTYMQVRYHVYSEKRKRAEVVL